MSELVQSLRKHGEANKGSDLGGLLQWAALHIEAQDEALAETRAELAAEEAAHQRMEGALHAARLAIKGALAAVDAPLCPPIDLGRDCVAHINLMAAHGDPDYLLKNGKSVRHVDCRTAKPRTKKGKTQ